MAEIILVGVFNNNIQILQLLRIIIFRAISDNDFVSGYNMAVDQGTNNINIYTLYIFSLLPLLCVSIKYMGKDKVVRGVTISNISLPMSFTMDCQHFMLRKMV